MKKYTLTPQQLQTKRTLIYSTGDYPLLSLNIEKKKGRIIDTGFNYVVHFADGSEPLSCRGLKDALVYVELCSLNEMPQTYIKSLK
jgi:hypothetical protein